MGALMADLTYAQWFDRLSPGIDRLEAQGWVFAPGTRRNAAMTAMGNQHNGMNASVCAITDLLQSSKVALTVGPIRVAAHFGATAYG